MRASPHCTGRAAPRVRLAAGEAYREVLSACWEAHVGPLVTASSPSAVLIVGKAVEWAIGSLVRQAVPDAEVVVIEQPNAHLDAVAHQRNRRNGVLIERGLNSAADVAELPDRTDRRFLDCRRSLATCACSQAARSSRKSASSCTAPTTVGRRPSPSTIACR